MMPVRHDVWRCRTGRYFAVPRAESSHSIFGVIHSAATKTRDRYRRRLSISGGAGGDREVCPGPFGKLRRWLAGDLVGESDCVARTDAEVRMRLEVGEHRRNA